ncbi:uncharacterized protein CIMG_01483 [Coccidioides immitis RS]|uniref:SGNH hydrolase-type esterase domain-containing protein n=2 Tax=Coccidioides immitis TaxID=5501 RepID=J3KJA9_COCIM|nr:uncharacterized protein CIMG_01483 [Coccidioides immitis RS]EAS36129.3 hypothetical protein CIMG_01483 [Coccidioides immitis RS]TPX25710.1 hypothetical protein DIZ76_011167 [Coccidioides immitis]
MRFSSRLHILIGLAVVGILYFSWYLGVFSVETLRNGYFDSPVSYRLVVFGDSWSDDGTIYRPLQTQVWPEMLCAQFQCTLEVTTDSPDPSFGAIIDNSELNNTGGETAADLNDQMSGWLNKEEDAARGVLGKATSRLKQNTIFVVSFGTWDLWQLAAEDLDTARESVQRIVEKMFAYLDELAEIWSRKHTKIILSLPVDVTFLPAFKTRQGVLQKDAVNLTDHWHNEVRSRAEQWKTGSIFLLDTNSFLIDQVRERQLWVGGLIEGEDFGKNGIAWENVNEPCVGPAKSRLKRKTCSDPEKFLFWDSLHLGPAAQQLLAAEVFNAIKELWLK